jgi:anti-anti-sigma factor
LTLDRPGTPLSATCSLKTERHLGTTILRLYGEFDLASDDGFRDQLDTVLDRETTTLLVDLRALQFMDSTGLRALVSIHKQAHDEGFDYAVLCGDGNVRRVLEETGLEGVLRLVDPEAAFPSPNGSHAA